MIGLAMTEVLRGFVRAVKEIDRSRIGFLTPLLGLVVMLDLVSFWLGAWQIRNAIPITFMSLIAGSVLASIYYGAAALTFPDEPQDWRDFDGWFFRHKAQVAAGLFVANSLFAIGELTAWGTLSTRPSGAFEQLFLLAGFAMLIFAKRPSHCYAVLALLLLVFAYSAVMPIWAAH